MSSAGQLKKHYPLSTKLLTGFPGWRKLAHMTSAQEAWFLPDWLETVRDVCSHCSHEGFYTANGVGRGGSSPPRPPVPNYQEVLLHLGCQQYLPLSHPGKGDPKGKMTQGTHPIGQEQVVFYELQGIHSQYRDTIVKQAQPKHNSTHFNNSSSSEELNLKTHSSL